MDTIFGMLIGALALVVGQMCVALLGPILIVPINRTHAKRRFKLEPLIQEGTILAEIRQGGSDRAVCGWCEIMSIRLGRIEVRLSEPPHHRMFWTLTEFEAFDPVVVSVPGDHAVRSLRHSLGKMRKERPDLFV